jgi:2-polyprenyl-3-methyl-5-hydroxy-6-metoxy-1,4-benzoquinol methylase
MKIDEIKNLLGKVDIYLLDQVMKNRYSLTDSILDVGCGRGWNLLFLDKLTLM